MNLTCIVERRLALQLESERSADHTDATDDLVISVLAGSNSDRHVVGYFTNAIGRQKPSDQHICGGPVKLLWLCPVERGYLKIASLFIIQNATKNARRVKVRKTEPIDGPIHSQECYRMHIADDSVIFDRLVGHGSFSLQRSAVIGRWSQRGSAEVDAKPFAPYRDSPVFCEVYCFGHVIILVSHVAFHAPKIDETSIFHGSVILSVWRRDQVDMNIGSVRCFEICQAE